MIATGTTDSPFHTQDSKLKHALDPALHFISPPSATMVTLLGGLFPPVLRFDWHEFVVFASQKCIQRHQRVSNLADVLEPADQALIFPIKLSKQMSAF